MELRTNTHTTIAAVCDAALRKGKRLWLRKKDLDLPMNQLFLRFWKTAAIFNRMIKLHPINGASYANINETFIPLFDEEPTRIESLRTDIERAQFLRQLLPLGSSYRGVLERALEN